MTTQKFVQEMEQGSATIGVVGLGYVGLPLVLTFGRKEFRVIGFDVDAKKVSALKSGKSYIRHIPSQEISELVSAQRFEPTTDFEHISSCDAIILCVPTPLNANREPNMSYVENTARSIAPFLRQGQLVVLESTTYPGTTSQLLRELLEGESGLKAGEDFWLAYSPEREDPGNGDFDTQRIPTVVGGINPDSQQVALALYRSVLNEVISVSSPEVAEMTKLLENIFRSVNIALVNELKILATRMGIDIWEVIEAASTKPFGFMPFYPGPGLGGHCIPIDPFYLTWKAREYQLSTRFIELAGEINTSMPNYVIERTTQALNQNKKPLNGSKILIMGLAYKKDVDDLRESPSFPIIEMLQKQGAQACYHDPYVPHTMEMRSHNLRMDSVNLSDELLQSVDAVLILTDHSNIDYGRIVDLAPLVIDTRNATADIVNNRHKIVKA